MSDKQSNDKSKLESNQTIKPLMTTEPSGTMENLNLIYLKLAIDGVPVLTQDNYSMWHTHILNYFNMLRIKDVFIKGEGKLSEDQEHSVRTILTVKLDAAVHVNVINHSNNNDAVLIWKAIVDYFASQHAANRARVWNNFSYLSFNNSDVNGFITNVKSSIEQLHEVGINIDTPEFNGISTAITHSGAAITPELALQTLAVTNRSLFLPMLPRNASQMLITHWPITQNINVGSYILIFNLLLSHPNLRMDPPST
ncbi:hypothetical protein VP01_7871g1, partial [Puccinia sorghi]